MNATNRDAFNPMMVMWLSLPGAAVCSIPISKWVVPRLLAGTGIPTFVPAFSDVEVLLLWLIPITAITSRQAYQHCISTTGHPGVRMALMIFNFVTRTFADLCIALFVFGSVVLTVMAIIMAIFG